MKFIQKLFLLFATVVSLTASISESNLSINQTPEITFVRKQTSNEISANNNTLSHFTYSVETTLNNKIDKYTFPNLLSSNYASRGERLLSKHNNEDLDFVFTHYKEIGIVQCDIYNSVLTTQRNRKINTFYGYSTYRNNKLDILFDFKGRPFYITDYIPNIDSGLSRDGFGELIGSGVASTFYFPAMITYDILNSDQALVRVGSYVNIPNIFHAGPFSYLIYLIKTTIALVNYTCNSLLENPTEKINNQDSDIYDCWKFGFSNVSASGCGAISLFNFLLDSHYGENEVTLATVILITELCNADLGFGWLGTNMLTEAMIVNYVNNFEETIINAILDFYEDFMDQVVEAIESIRTSIDCDLVDWILGFISFSIQLTGDLIISTIITTIVLAAEFVETVVCYYVEFLGSFETVYFAITCDHPISSYYSYQAFYSVMSTRAQGFIAFWNSVGENGNVTITDGAHYVYIIRKSSTQYIAYNTSQGQITKTSLSSLLNSVLNNRINKLITGYVVQPSN